jgi:hypothetical protein
MRLQKSAMILKCELWCESSGLGVFHLSCDNVRRLFIKEWRYSQAGVFRMRLFFLFVFRGIWMYR